MRSTQAGASTDRWRALPACTALHALTELGTLSALYIVCTSHALTRARMRDYDNKCARTFRHCVCWVCECVNQRLMHSHLHRSSTRADSHLLGVRLLRSGQYARPIKMRPTLPGQLNWRCTKMRICN
jgi:hypothetical protein